MRNCEVCGGNYIKGKSEGVVTFSRRKFCSKSCSNTASAAKRAELLIGKKFGLLTAVRKSNDKERNSFIWEWKCDCGNTKLATSANIKAGGIKSCGCYRRQVNSEYGKKVGGWNKTHGMSQTRIHNIWHSMLERSYKQSSPNPCYEGVTVCKKWLSFEKFYEDMFPTYKENLTLDRKEGTKGYSKENCRWATKKEQARNMKSNRIIYFANKKMCMAEWAEELSIPYSALSSRLYRGWPIEKALTTPVNRR